MHTLRHRSRVRSHDRRSLHIVTLALCVGTALCQASLAAPPMLADPSAYDIEEVVNLGGDDSRAYGINNDGTVVGYTFPAGCCAHAFDSAMTPPFSNSAPSYAQGIDQAGDVIGDLDVSGGGGCYHAAQLWPHVIDFDHDEHTRCSYGIAINESGGVLAQRYGPLNGDPRKAMVRDGNRWDELEPPLQEPPGYGPNTRAGGMNELNEVVGIVETNPTLDIWHPGRAFYWDQAIQSIDLTTTTWLAQPYEIRNAAAINKHHRIVGFASPDPTTIHAYALDRLLYDASAKAMLHTFTDLGTLPGGGISYALGLNTGNDAVVGAAYQDASGAGNYVATLFAHNQVIDLNKQLSRLDAMQWLLKEATGINDNGEITGWGQHNGVIRAYILRPHAHITVTGVTQSNGALLTIEGSGFFDAAPVTIEMHDIDIGGPSSMGPLPAVTASTQGRFSLTVLAPCSRILAINAWDGTTSTYSNMQKLIVPCIH